MKWVIAVVLLASPASLAFGQTRAPGRDRVAQPQAGQDYHAQAYEQFLLARRDADEDKVDEAIAAYKRAMALDPGAADIPAELAALYLDQNRAQDAIDTAQQALKIDANNREAHRVLGLVYAALAEGSRRGRRPGAAAPPAQADDHVATAISHLEKALDGAVGGGDPNLRATLSRLYLRAGSYDKAIPLLTELVNEEPGWDDGPGLLAEAYAGAGRDEDAIRWLQQAAPNDPQLYATLADFYERSHRWKDAADAYSKVMDLAPRNVDLKIRYASALLNAGGRANAGRARDVLKDVLAAHTDDARTLYLLSQADRRMGDFAAAEADARKIIAVNNTSPWGYYALAEALEQRRQYAAVVDALDPAVAQIRSRGGDTTTGLSLLLPHLGFAYQQLGQQDKALAAFEEAHQLQPKDEAITGYLIEAQLAAKRYQQAAELARQARADSPDDMRLTRLEAQALQKSGKTADAASLMQQLIETHADKPEAYVSAAQFDVSADRASDALTLLQQAKTKFPDDSSIAFELGAVYDKLNKRGEAEAQFKQILARDPENAAALNYLGYMFADHGEKLDESVQLLKKALELEPDNGSFLDSLGWAYFKSDRFDLAEENLRRAAEQLTTNSVVQAHYGDVLFKLRRYGDAIAAWTRALNGDGEDINTKDINAKIRSAREKLGRK